MHLTRIFASLGIFASQRAVRPPDRLHHNIRGCGGLHHSLRRGQEYRDPAGLSCHRWDRHQRACGQRGRHAGRSLEAKRARHSDGSLQCRPVSWTNRRYGASAFPLVRLASYL
jgi:hypothetical protein